MLIAYSLSLLIGFRLTPLVVKLSLMTNGGDNPNRIKVLYDPLCGWCYGATPAVRRLLGDASIRLELAPTGLFSGEGARPMDAGFGVAPI